MTELLTPAQVAKILKVSVRALQKPKFRAILPPVKLAGWLVRYDAADIEAAIQRMKTNPSKE